LGQFFSIHESNSPPTQLTCAFFILFTYLFLFSKAPIIECLFNKTASNNIISFDCLSAYYILFAGLNQPVY